MRSSADDARLAAAVKADDGFFATFFVSSYSPRLVRLAARVGLRPNQVTVASLAVGLGAAAGFAVGSRAGLVVGALLLQVSFTLDVVDGQLARYTSAMSEFGGWFDGMVDRLKEYAAYAGLAIGSQRGFHHDVWALAGAALVMQTARHHIDFCYAAGRKGVRRDPHRNASYWARRIIVLPIGERLLLISLTAAIFRPEVTFVALLSWGGLATGYTLAGRVVRALSHQTQPDPAQSSPAPADAAPRLNAYRDDGVAGALLARLPRLPGPALVPAAIGAVPWFVLLPMTPRHEHRGLIAAALAWLIVWGAASGCAAHLAKLDFLVPPLLFVAVGVGILRMAAISGDHDVAAGFAVVLVIVMRHYDLVYRDVSGRPRTLLELLSGGWGLQLVVAYALSAGSVVDPGFYALAAALTALLCGHQIWAWQDPETRPEPLAGAGSEAES
jgi:phosphatidylglycerophosphate synthase